MVPLHPLFFSGVTTTQPSQPVVDPQSIAKQQADLQAKILSILNPGGGAKPAGTSTTSSSLSQQTKPLSGGVAPAVQTPAKPAALSNTGNPIFPLYPAQQKPAASAGSGAYMTTATAAARVPAGATASRPTASTQASQVGKAYQTASPYGSTASPMAGKPATSYQFTKPAAPVAQSTYSVGFNQAATAASSSSVYGTQVAQPVQNYSAGTQAQSRHFVQPQRSPGATVARSPIPVVSKFSPAGQAIGTVGAARSAVNSAPNVGRGAPTTVGPRPVSNIAVGQVRTPSPGIAKGRAGLLGAAPASGIATRPPAPSGTVRTPSPSGAVRMGTPRGPSPVGRGTVRTPSPAGIPRAAAPTRGAAISVLGAGAARPPLAQSPAGSGRGSVAPSNRGALAQRGAPTARGIPTRGGPAAPSRGTPMSRGAPSARGTLAPRGAQAPRGSPAPRGASVTRGGAPMRGGGPMRGAPNGRGAPGRPMARGGPSGQGGPMNRGAPRGRSMARGGPPFRGGRGGY